MKICKNCTCENPDKANYCGYCGLCLGHNIILVDWDNDIIMKRRTENLDSKRLDLIRELDSIQKYVNRNTDLIDKLDNTTVKLSEEYAPLGKRIDELYEIKEKLRIQLINKWDERFLSWWKSLSESFWGMLLSFCIFICAVLLFALSIVYAYTR